MNRMNSQKLTSMLSKRSGENLDQLGGRMSTDEARIFFEMLSRFVQMQQDLLKQGDASGWKKAIVGQHISIFSYLHEKHSAFFDTEDFLPVREHAKWWLFGADLQGDHKKTWVKVVGEAFEGNRINFFRVVHLYGLSGDFEDCCSNQLYSRNIRQAYKNWKRVNTVFIEECAVQNGIETSAYQSQLNGKNISRDQIIFLKRCREEAENNRNSKKTRETYRLLGQIITGKLESCDQVLKTIMDCPEQLNAHAHADIVLASSFAWKIIAQEGGSGNSSVYSFIYFGGFGRHLEDAISEKPFSKAWIECQSWKAENQEFISSLSAVRENYAILFLLRLYSDRTSDEKARKFYDVCRIVCTQAFFSSLPDTSIAAQKNGSLQTAKDYISQGMVGCIRYFLDNREYITSLEHSHAILFALTVALCVIREDDDISKHPLNAMPLEEFFDFVRLTGIESTLEQVLGTENFPHVHFSDYQSWKETGIIPSREDEVPEGVQESPEVVDHCGGVFDDPRVTVTKVYEPLVLPKMGRHVGFDSCLPSIKLEDDVKKLALVAWKFVDRTTPLLESLMTDKTITRAEVCFDKRLVNDQDVILNRPYNVINIEMNDGSRNRIIISDYGSIIYVDRNPAEMCDGKSLSMDELLSDPKIWTVRHVSDMQAAAQLKSILDIPLEDLGVEIKSRSYWKGAREALIESFAGAVMATGKVPGAPGGKLRDVVFQYGPLKGKTTHDRAYHAIYRHGVDGIPEDVNGHKALFRYLTEPQDYNDGQPEYPLLKDFLNRVPLTAEGILNACNKFQMECGEKPVPENCYELVRIDKDRTAEHADLAIRFGVVAMPSGILPEESDYPQNLQEFLHLSAMIMSKAPVCQAA